MDTRWELVESGPADAPQTVLLLPGGMCSARSYAEVMAEPSLQGVRLIAATMPGHAGAPPPDDFSAEHYVQITAELAKSKGVDVVAGFSMGAQVAFNMVVSGAFAGPVVLLGISLSSPDEPLFFRAIIRLGSVLGTLPAAVLKMGIAPMVKKAPLPPGAPSGADRRLREEQHAPHAPRTARLRRLAPTRRRPSAAVLRDRCPCLVPARGEGGRRPDRP
jgi:pimeloyl-ACP methyl ester carboxylesterase